MEVEIIEAYLIKKNADEKPRGWSLHVYIPEWEMDIRAIRLIKSNSNWFCTLPHLQNYDVEEKKIIRFPVISFSDTKKTKELKEKIKLKAIEYIENKLKDCG